MLTKFLRTNLLRKYCAAVKQSYPYFPFPSSPLYTYPIIIGFFRGPRASHPGGGPSSAARSRPADLYSSSEPHFPHRPTVGEELISVADGGSGEWGAIQQPSGTVLPVSPFAWFWQRPRPKFLLFLGPLTTPLGWGETTLGLGGVA